MRKNIEEGLYKKILKNIPIPTIDVLIFNNSLNKTLLFLRKNSPVKGEYYSIGGRLEKGESLLEGAINNFLDETGIKIDEENLYPIGTINEIFEETSFGKKWGIHSVNYYFAWKLEKEPKIKLDGQHSECKWFDVNDPNLHPYMKEKIRKSLDLLSKKIRK